MTWGPYRLTLDTCFTGGLTPRRSPTPDMLAHHYVRVGLFGHVGRFASAEGVRFPRHSEVVCRTERGLEIGEVLAADESGSADVDGMLVRKVTVEDQLLLARLEKNKHRAFEACSQILRERGLLAVLMDVEHLFDGRSLYFYFLGEITPDLDAITTELAAAYDAEVQFQRFAQTLTEGCGPGCGTEAAAGSGCGTSGCASCLLAGGCGSRHSL